jgi:DNA-binding CsgD family transcriptional regulator
MNPFFDVMQRTQESPLYAQMLRFSKPLSDHFGINHFWYYRILRSGAYSYVGTHAAWNEYCFDQSLLSHFPCLRHPNVLGKGISLMKAGGSSEYKQVLQNAWDKFHINFNINLFENTTEGIEAFGFATRFSGAEVDEKLINELPTLRYFIQEFRERHSKLFKFLWENTVDLSSTIGEIFYERPKGLVLPFNRTLFLKELGCDAVHITPREKEILKLLSNGFPASYIGERLHLGIRTVENYIVVIKDKFATRSKVDLIRKAQELHSSGMLE